MRDPIRYRDPDLVHAILDAVYTGNDPDDKPEPTPWTDLVDAFTSATHEWKTVDNTLRDLVAIGAIHRIGKPSTRGRPDTRALLPTILGRAWLAGELHPLPGQDVDP